MSQDLLYSVLARPTLKPADLVYNRRVASSDKSSRSKESTTRDYEDEVSLSEGATEFRKIFEKNTHTEDDEQESSESTHPSIDEQA